MADVHVPTEKFTRRDYMALPEGFPAELIEGAFVREPSPTYRHQRLITRLLSRLVEIVGPDRTVPAPTDVFVDDWNVLQPDVLVIRPEALADADVQGPGIPILVVEVLSPSTARRDRERKTGIYLRAGVLEVWLVDPESGTVEIHMTGGVERFAGEARAASVALLGFTLAWSDLAT